ncbi:DELTA-sagatoxin-Srs1a-like [Bombina bombina]|uniref:DELTA-sagatoxin-Srs1a-like n=1 Tax=Bombina bombina TaxID=8345 RepID=UPI00235AB0EF|nr:DELTA-sagatoxin-Srs1a-like [Bombina bombina]
MQNSMVEILSKVDAGRSVGIELINRTKSITLNFKSSFCESGHMLSPPSSTVSPGSKEICIFVKTPGTACGSVGLIVYHFQRNSLVVMFSNPFDRNIFSTICGVWITDETVQADHGLFNDLYYDKMPSLSFQRLVVGRDTQALEVSKDNVVVKATMSDDYKAILKLEITDKN